METRITADELTMLRDYILLPHMESMVQRSITDIEHSTNILRKLYAMAGSQVLDQIVKDRYRLRQELRKRDIRILAEEQNPTNFIINHRYYCRGYQDTFGMTRDVMKSEISTRLSKYISDIAGSTASRE